MYIYSDTCMFVWTGYINICMYMYMYMHMYKYTHTVMAAAELRGCECLHIIYFFAWWYVHILNTGFIYICVNTIHTHTHSRTHTRTSARAQTHTHSLSLSLSLSLSHTHTHTRTHSHTHTHLQCARTECVYVHAFVCNIYHGVCGHPMNNSNVEVKFWNGRDFQKAWTGKWRERMRMRKIWHLHVGCMFLY